MLVFLPSLRLPHSLHYLIHRCQVSRPLRGGRQVAQRTNARTFSSLAAHDSHLTTPCSRLPNSAHSKIHPVLQVDRSSSQGSRFLPQVRRDPFSLSMPRSKLLGRQPLGTSQSTTAHSSIRRRQILTKREFTLLRSSNIDPRSKNSKSSGAEFKGLSVAC